MAVVAFVSLLFFILMVQSGHGSETGVIALIVLFLLSVVVSLLLSPWWMARVAYRHHHRIHAEIAAVAVDASAHLDEVFVSGREMDEDATSEDRHRLAALKSGQAPGPWLSTTAVWLRGVGASLVTAAVVVAAIALLILLAADMEVDRWSPTASNDPEIQREWELLGRGAAIAGTSLVLLLVAGGLLLRFAGSVTRLAGWKHLEEDEAWLRDREAHYLKLRRDAASS